jgi:hypothetical protein
VAAANAVVPEICRENDVILPFKDRPFSILVLDTVMVPTDSDMVVMLQVRTVACEVAGAYSMHRLSAERMLQTLLSTVLRTTT